MNLSRLRKHGFLLGLAVSFTLGATCSEVLRPLSDWGLLRNGIVAAVMFVMALPLGAAVIRRTLARPWPSLLAVAATYGVLPALAWPLSLAFDDATGRGILVASVTPCTLASAAVWTQRGGGNDAAAILVTVITNVTSFLIAPAWLWVMVDTSLPTDRWLELIPRLGWIVVLPIVAAQSVRWHAPIATWSTAHRKGLAVAAQTGILIMVMLGTARMMQETREAEAGSIGVLPLVAMATAVVALHLSVLMIGWFGSGALGMPHADRVAVAIAGSQKTLMVGLWLAIELRASVLPIVTFHVSQLFLDTLIVDRWARRAGGTGTASPGDRGIDTSRQPIAVEPEES